MDRLVKNEAVGGPCKQQQQQEETATDLFLKWGNKKRLRCVRTKDPDESADPVCAVSGRRRIRRRLNSRFVTFPSDNTTTCNNNNNNINNNKQSSLSSIAHLPTRLTRNSETTSNLRSESHRKPPPEKETNARGASTVGKPSVSPGDGGVEHKVKVKHVWPKLYIALSSKEKEEDFMAMKGCKPSHRPKKRPKAIQRSLLLVSPGAWLTDICQDRYEVIEKKNTKKRPTGLKAMGSMESDSE